MATETNPITAPSAQPEPAPPTQAEINAALDHAQTQQDAQDLANAATEAATLAEIQALTEQQDVIRTQQEAQDLADAATEAATLAEIQALQEQEEVIRTQQDAQDLIDAAGPENIPVDQGLLDQQAAINGAILSQREEAAAAAADANAMKLEAQGQQNTADSRAIQKATDDWRVKLQLAKSADYLYNDPDVIIYDILHPLKITNGVIFPYTPTISTSYKAKYSEYDLTHSNFKGYFYQSSSVEPISLKCAFTAQDTEEANYVLAVIHFFRSVTKMFYGKDAQRGAPPPLVFLTGLGQYQFNNHPCLVSNFSYSLPGEVDYIRAGSKQNLTNQPSTRSKQTNPNSFQFAGLNRLFNSSLFKGATNKTPGPTRAGAVGSLGYAGTTYVPTKMDIDITLLPVQSRESVSKNFSLKNFANGNLLKGGYW